MLLLSAGVALAVGAGNDLIPDIPLGAHTVKLQSLASIAPDLLIEIETPPDGSGRLFLVSPNGVIRIYKEGSVLPTPFYSIPAFPSESA